MRNVDIEIYTIAKTAVDPAEVQRWLDHLGASDQYQGDIVDLMNACKECGQAEMELDSEVTSPALLIALAAKRCYMSFEAGLNPNVTKVRKDFTDYIDNILKSGHGSVLEHATYTFAIEGVSRVFTGEMNRHRAGVGISEGSMRFIRYDDIPWWMPTSIQISKEEKDLQEDFDEFAESYRNKPEELARIKLIAKKRHSQQVFERAFKEAERFYQELQVVWKDELAPESKFAAKKHITSMMRRIIPMGVATGGVWTMNMRAVRHIMAMRASPAAEEEILHVFSRIAKMMVESEPMLCGDFSQDPDGFWAPKYPKV